MDGDIDHLASVSATRGEESAPLRSLKRIRPLYILPQDPLAQEVLIPGFRAADAVDCMVGYFSSAVLASLAPGLASYINRSENTFRLVISPHLRPEDLAAIEEGLRTPEELASELLESLVVTEDLLERHTLRCLTYLLRTGRMQFKVALLEDGLFHPKVWLFQAGSDVIGVHGSSNVTYAGLRKNVEQIAISKSWEDPNQYYVANKLREQFDRLWQNREDSCIVVSLPEALKNSLINRYGADAPPTEADLGTLMDRSTAISDVHRSYDAQPLPPTAFSIPPGLRYEDGPFAHQGDAVQAWCDANFGGVLEMATGSGKTVTAMIAAHRLFELRQPLLIVVAAPYVPLIQQWCDEIALFGLRPIDLTLPAGTRGRANELSRLRRRLTSGASSVEAVVVSHKTLCTASFKAELSRFACTTLLIADEVHNLGAPGFVADPPTSFQFRLGLSATPLRQYDEQGTQALLAFFGPVVFRFTLGEAIGRCLVPYDYYVHPVVLTDDEMDQWHDITAKIKANAWRQDEGKPDDYLAKLFRDRRLLLENASNKVGALNDALRREDVRALRHTLIYASDKAPEQLDAVNALLGARGILFHQLTYQETANRGATARILRSFQEGTLRVLTAKRVLDEGVNIPQIQRAFILASTTVERQWTQRRGRLLRTCPRIGKTHAEIHDFLALPSDLQHIDKEARALIQGELLRAQEFARLARNAGRTDGPLSLIHSLVKAAFN